jgi:RHS repeat-associated protein
MAHIKIVVLLERILKITIALKPLMPSRRWSATAAGMCGVLFASAAVADQWAWTYGSTSYATKAAAIAAMQSSAPPQSTVLTQESSIGGIGNASVSYQYSVPQIPVPTSSYGPWIYCSGIRSPCPGAYASEAAFESSVVNSFPTSSFCNVSILPTTDWTNIAPQFADSEEARSYVVTYGNVQHDGSCLYPTGTLNTGINRLRTYSCPTGYYGYLDPNGLCFSLNIALISHRLLDCPQAGGSAIIGDPCDAATGDYYYNEVDYKGPALRFSRFYHSETLPSHNALGIGWGHNFSAHLVINPGNGQPLGLERPDGHQDEIQLTNGAYIGISGAGIHLDQNQSTYNFTAHLADGSSELYDTSGNLLQIITSAGLATTLARDSNGNLLAVTDPFGHTLQFTYINGLISAVTDPAGSQIIYAYDTHNNLNSVTYADGTITTYLYENAGFANHLTGVSDESMNRYSTIAYDSTGRVISSQLAGGANAVTITGYGDTSTSMVDALGATTTFTFTNQRYFTRRVQNIVRNALTQSYAVPAPSVDTQQRALQSVDPNGNITTYSYDTDHLTSKTEAFGTSVARATSYQYLSTMSALPTLITEPLSQTSYAYFPGTNNVQTKTITDVATSVARTWTYTYNTNGQMLTIDGPRTDVLDLTTYTYYTCATGNQCGQISTITNAAGQVATFNTYNAHGQPLTITDPNGVVTTLTYDLRQRMKSRQVGTETTNYVYYPTGLLETVTLPDSSTVQYSYDTAHRLTGITDGAGNSIAYTLDAMGNRTAESTYDPSSTLHGRHSRVYNSLNELYQDINAANTAAVTTSYGHDSNGNRTTINAPLSRNTTKAYDELNRLNQITDPASGITQFGYDANDNLTSVQDPRSLTTTYTYNGFGDLTEQVSPDTGTATNTYDSGGNLFVATDARLDTANYSYDALNRVTSIVYKNGSGVADQTLTFGYDAGTNGKGRLTSAADGNHALSWTYDGLGRVTGKGQTVGTVTKSVGYGYTNGNLTAITTPSGQAIVYSYNANHQVTGITISGTTLLSSVIYEPFGAVHGWTWGNGTASSRSYDLDGRISQIVSASTTNAYTYDDASRITAISDSSNNALAWTYGYDTLDRLSNASNTDTAFGWSYDADGNRSSQTGTSATAFNINTANSQLTSTTGALSRTYDYNATGMVITNGSNTFGYNNRGRMVSTTAGSTNYLYNALGQLIEKSGSGGTTLYVYDESGHLLGEYDGSGNLMQETIWLGDIPVATLQFGTSALKTYYVHTDHLNTPRRITNRNTGAIVWRWDSDPFGNGAATQNPQGSVTVTYNLRFPGQIYLTETGLNYNYFRTYDPQMGRYIESDPIGLRAGVNTYAYANENPVKRVDPSGLFGLSFTDDPYLVDSVPDGPPRIGETFARHMTIDCACKEECDGAWVLTECTARIRIEIYIKKGSIDQMAMAIHDEQQHVDDYRAGLDKLGVEGYLAEHRMERLKFSSEADCKSSSGNAIGHALSSVLNDIRIASQNEYDYPHGPHWH